MHEGYENDGTHDSVAYFNEDNTSFCTVDVELPEDFKKGILFIGLFHTLIPNHAPVSALATKSLMGNKQKNIPSGNYYLLCCAVNRSHNILTYFNLDKSLRGKKDERMSFPACSGNRYTIKLREPIPEDPPILINVGKLLISRLKNTIQNNIID